MARLLLIILSLWSVAGRVVAGSEPTTIEGVFVDDHTNQGVAGARVELYQRRWRFSFEREEDLLTDTQTDAQGHFRFVGTWHGQFRLRCYSPNCRKVGTQVVCGAAAHGLQIEARSADAKQSMKPTREPLRGN
jgi:hypothetical protein